MRTFIAAVKDLIADVRRFDEQLVVLREYGPKRHGSDAGSLGTDGDFPASAARLTYVCATTRIPRARGRPSR